MKLNCHASVVYHASLRTPQEHKSLAQQNEVPLEADISRLGQHPPATTVVPGVGPSPPTYRQCMLFIGN